MAVYTAVDAEEIAALLFRYGLSPLHSAKGIAEGVENSNYLLDAGTGAARRNYILTLYERRVAEGDLPFFIALTDHLNARGCPVARMLADRDGRVVQEVAGRPACLIEFLSGVSPTRPIPAQARAAGGALARLHLAARDFPHERQNPFDLAGLRALLSRIGGRCDDLLPGLADAVEGLADEATSTGLDQLPHGIVHADAFPDNLLFEGDRVSGVIDFYFACSDSYAWDFAVTHSAWCFDDAGTIDPRLSEALASGYEEQRPFDECELEALPLLARRAALRFTLTRAFDWVETPADALVARKDPRQYWARYEAYRTASAQAILGR